jgi:hypothetical protein
MISVKVFLTHDNVFKLEVSKGGTAVDLTAAGVTRVVVTSPSAEIDSDVNASAFDFATEGDEGIIEFDFADLALGIGKQLCDLTIYDAAHAAGQVWEDAFEMTVKAAR